MQSIELIVFFIASITIASLIIMFIGGINPDEIYQMVKDLVFPKPLNPDSVLQTTKAGFVGKMGACWEQCGFGAKNLNCGSFHITDEGLSEEEKSLDSASLEEIFEKYNYCTGCTVSLPPSTIQLPAVVSLECKNNGLVITG